MEHSNLSWKRFWQHFFKSISKFLETIDVDHSAFSLPSFKKQPEVLSMPKAWSTQTSLGDGFGGISHVTERVEPYRGMLGERIDGEKKKEFHFIEN